MIEVIQQTFGNTLTRVVFFPTLACLPLLLLRRATTKTIKQYTLSVTLIELGLIVTLISGRIVEATLRPLLELGANGQFIPWIERYGITYSLMLDGISAPLVALTGLLLPLVVLGSWKGIGEHWIGYTACLFLLTTGMLGALLATDLFLFYVFWEVMLIPMYLLIGIWGGERRIYAAIKFFLFTMAGSLLMLLAVLWMGWTYYETAGVWSFHLTDLSQLQLPFDQQLWLFGAFALAFAIKVPMFPFHTWLPDAHVEAPTGGSVFLAGVLLKLGTYGFLRFAIPLFPHAAVRLQPLLVTLALIGIIYGGLVAWAQEDIKKLVAYSSVAHLGFVMLGLLAFDFLAWQGSLLQMVNHGISTGALFLLVGMLYDRRHTKLFSEFGGLAKVMPWFAFFLVFSSLASVGLPGLNGFVGEFLILTGAFRSELILPTVLATFGVVIAAIYLLKMLQQTLWGPLTKDENKQLVDLSWREILTIVPLAILMLWIGVAPKVFIQPSSNALEATLERFKLEASQEPPSRPRLAVYSVDTPEGLPEEDGIE